MTAGLPDESKNIACGRPITTTGFFILIWSNGDGSMDNHSDKYLTFSLEEEFYGIPIKTAKEIIGMQEVTHIPKTKGYIKGVINLRGKIIPIIDLRLKFGMAEKAYTDRTCIIVIEVNLNASRRSLGIVVDAVTEVRNIQKDELETMSYDTQTVGDLLMGFGKMNDKVILIIDIEKIVNKDDAVIIKKTLTEQELKLEESSCNGK
jgi:purine-binding chemotaxis protein CheW